MSIKRKAILFYLSIPIFQRLKNVANKKGLNLSELLRRIIDEYLEQIGG